MAVVQTVELSSYIIAFAGAAKAAQLLLSDGADPMTITEYNFEIEISSTFEASSETSISLNVWRLTLKETITVNMSESWKIKIGCTIAPTVTLN